MAKILIVDDNADNLYMLEVILKGNGFEVVTATNGLEALERAHETPPDLIISDILMPVMDGFSLCRKWKTDEKLKPQEPETWVQILEEIFNEDYTEKTTLTKPLGEEMEFFRQHNEILFNKLEKKMLDLEISNQSLKASEEKLLQGQRLYEDLINTQPSGVYRLHVKMQGKWEAGTWRSMMGRQFSIDLASDRFCEILGISHDEFMTNPGLVPDLVYPDDKNDFNAKNVQAMIDFSPFCWEGRMICNNQIRWIHFESLPRVVYPETVLWTGVVYDITERKGAEEKLRASEEHYRSLFDNMLNGYAYCKMLFEQDQPKDFIYLNVNSSFETLTGLKNVTGKRVSEVIPGIQEMDPELFSIYGRVALTGIPERFEKFLNALGIWFSISVYSPQREHFVVVFDVITERKLAEEKLKQKMHDLERFHILTIDRELRIRDLKREINALLKKAGEEEKYRIVE